MNELLDSVDLLEGLIAQAMILLERPASAKHSSDLRRAISDAVAAIGLLGPPAFDDPKRRYAFHSELALLRSATVRHFAPGRAGAKRETRLGAEGSLKGLALTSQRFTGWIRYVATEGSF